MSSSSPGLGVKAILTMFDILLSPKSCRIGNMTSSLQTKSGQTGSSKRSGDAGIAEV